jgi:hypothetical protein
MGARPAPLRQHRLLPTVTKHKQQRNMSSARRHDTDSDDDSAQQSRCKSNSRGARNFSEGDDNDFASDTIERIEECFSDDPDHFQDGFRDDQSEGPPSLVSSSGDDEDDQRDRDEF